MIDINKYLGFMDENVLEVTEAVNKQFLNNLWNYTLYGNPVNSGLSRYSWRMTNTNKTAYKPELPDGYNYKTRVRVFSNPAKPKVLRTGKTFKTYVMFNNQDYVTKLNNWEGKYYYQFIDDAIRSAVIVTDINSGEKVSTSGLKDA